MSLLTSTPNKYASYTPRMLNMIMTRYQNRKDSESQLDIAKQLLTDFNQLWAGSDNISKLTANSIVQKYTREKNRITNKRKKSYAAKKAAKKATNNTEPASTPTLDSKASPAIATLRGFCLKKVLDANSFTITEVEGKLTITLE